MNNLKKVKAKKKPFSTKTKKLNPITKKSPDKISYVVYDLETTGGNPTNNNITEIGALKVYNGMVIDKFYSLVNPKMRIPPIVRRITGLTNSMLRDEPTIDQVIPGFYDFIDDCVLVSHNAMTDFQFIEFYVKKVLKKTINNHYLCTQKLGERVFPETKSRSLQGFCEHLKLPSLDFHRADDDARATQFLFLKILDALKKHNFKSLEELIRYQGDVRASLSLGPRFSEAKTAAVPAKCGVLTLKDTEGKPIFVCSSFNMLSELRKLRNLASLPKSLLKVMLEVASFDHKVHPTLFSAMVEESKLLHEYGITYSAHNWHLRAVNSLCFSEHKDGIVVKCKTSDNKVVNAFGPVHDQIKVMEAIKAIVPLKGEVKKRKNIILERKSYDSLMQVFDHLFLKSSSRLKHYFNLISSSAYRGIYFKSKKHLKSFSFNSLLGENGFIVERVEGERLCCIYKVENSMVISTAHMPKTAKFDKSKLSFKETFETDPNVFAWWKFRYRKASAKNNKVEYEFHQG